MCLMPGISFLLKCNWQHDPATCIKTLEHIYTFWHFGGQREHRIERHTPGPSPLIYFSPSCVESKLSPHFFFYSPRDPEIQFSQSSSFHWEQVQGCWEKRCWCVYSQTRVLKNYLCVTGMWVLFPHSFCLHRIWVQFAWRFCELRGARRVCLSHGG